MTEDRATLIASAIVLGSGAFWGLYWVPVRMLSDLGLGGAWGTAAITLVTVLLLAPYGWLGRDQIARTSRMALASVALGGAAFALYSISFLYGRVAINTLLYFLTPVWSTLIGRFVMGWPAPPLRLVAIGVGLAGLGVMLGADGQVPIPRGIGEWMALVAGVLWSVSTTGIRVTSDLSPGPASFVFALGATVAGLALAPLLDPWPAGQPVPWTGLGLAALTGLAWWGLSLAALMWATLRL